MPARRDPLDLAQSLGRTIQVLRADAGVERSELADRARISYSYLSAIESGRKQPSGPVLGRIAAALGLRGHELLGAAERRLDRAGDSPERRLLWHEAGAAAAALSQGRTGSLAELNSLLPALDADELELLLQLARRLASGS
jgi:transcriptional regulator with XRE-family HTH domain